SILNMKCIWPFSDSRLTPARARQRMGIAMILVISAIAIAAVLGFALLSTATLHTRTSGNSLRIGSADYLAESGVNLALYYIPYPSQAPSLNGNAYWGGTGGHTAI